MRFCLSVLSALIAPAIVIAQQPPRPVTNGGLPAVSPKGDVIAFVSNRDGNYDVYITTADGSNQLRITNSPAPESAPVWTSSANLVFATWADNKSTVYSANSNDPTPRVIGTVAVRQPSVSPDGKKLLYSKGQFPSMQIAESGLDGSTERELTRTPSAQFNATYSPDQKQIAFARMDSTRQLQVFVMNADGTGERQLTRFAADEGSPQWPAWSPDGARLAIQSGKYDRQNPSANTAHIWLIDVKSGAPIKLNPHGAYLDETPSWFPDGKRIAFQSNRSGRMEIWVMNADGTGAVQITK
jgi:Tol biopolymer transport system component